MTTRTTATTIHARDGYPLAATVSEGNSSHAVIVNGAMGVPARFYRHIAAGFAARDTTTITYDYRGVASSAPDRLRGFDADIVDWFELDMAGVVDWASERFDRVDLIGHSLGGQLAGMLPNADCVSAMTTIVAQSGHWRHQGGIQPLFVAAHAYLLLPFVTRLFGYTPFSRIGFGEDVPRDVGSQWARWIRDPDYLLGDTGLPLERFDRFPAPVLAYSVDDDHWGTARAVDAMMRAYPDVERRHLVPSEYGLESIGHMGAFRPGAEPIWAEILEWLCESNRSA